MEKRKEQKKYDVPVRHIWRKLQLVVYKNNQFLKCELATSDAVADILAKLLAAYPS